MCKGRLATPCGSWSLTRQLTRCRQQLVHGVGGVRSSNVLCACSEIAALIDFEEARIDHCIDEATRSAVLLGTRFRD